MSATARTINTAAIITIATLALASFSISTAAATAHARSAGNGLKCAKTARVIAHHGHGKIVV